MERTGGYIYGKGRTIGKEKNRMEFKTETGKDGVTIFLTGRIDTNNAAEVEREIFSALEGRNPDAGEVMVDTREVEYISSAGLRVLMKLRKHIGKPLAVRNVSRDVYDIFETTGFTELFDVKKALRKVSVAGCEVIGAGGHGSDRSMIHG